MQNTHLPISTWIIAAYLLTTSRKGVSSLKLASLLGCSIARLGIWRIASGHARVRRA